MKNIKTTMMLVMLVASQVMAQRPGGAGNGSGGHGGEDRGKMYMQKLDSIVTLTVDQKVKIESIQTEYQAKFKVMRESSDEMDRDKMMRMREEQQAKIKSVLTPEQATILDEAMDEQKQNMKKMRVELKKYRETNRDPTMQRLHSVFEEALTADEKAKIEVVRSHLSEMKKGFYAANGDSAVHGPGKGEMHGGKGKHQRKGLTSEQRKAVHTYAQTELKTILDNHDALLTKTMKDLEPMQLTWKAEMQAIQKKYGFDDKTKKDSSKDKSKGKKGKSTKTEDQTNWNKIGFILSHDE